MDDSQDLELKRPGRVEKEDPQEGILLWQGSVFPKCGSGPPKPECSTHQPLMIEYSPDLPKAHSSLAELSVEMKISLGLKHRRQRGRIKKMVGSV